MPTHLHTLFQPKQANGRDPAYRYRELPPPRCWLRSSPVIGRANLLAKETPCGNIKSKIRG